MNEDRFKNIIASFIVLYFFQNILFIWRDALLICKRNVLPAYHLDAVIVFLCNCRDLVLCIFYSSHEFIIDIDLNLLQTHQLAHSRSERETTITIECLVSLLAWRFLFDLQLRLLSISVRVFLGNALVFLVNLIDLPASEIYEFATTFLTKIIVNFSGI